MEHAIELLDENWKILIYVLDRDVLRLALRILEKKKNVQVTAIDVSKSALLVAKENDSKSCGSG